MDSLKFRLQINTLSTAFDRFRSCDSQLVNSFSAANGFLRRATNGAAPQSLTIVNATMFINKKNSPVCVQAGLSSSVPIRMSQSECRSPFKCLSASALRVRSDLIISGLITGQPILLNVISLAHTFGIPAYLVILRAFIGGSCLHVRRSTVVFAQCAPDSSRIGRIV